MYNINIQCSSGFYEAVPKPSLSIIQEGYQIVVNGATVECLEARDKVDQLGRNDSLLVRFRVQIHGNVVIHLHHTQQLMQVQGSACNWFVENVVKTLNKCDIHNLLTPSMPSKPSMPTKLGKNEQVMPTKTEFVSTKW